MPGSADESIGSVGRSARLKLYSPKLSPAKFQ